MKSPTQPNQPTQMSPALPKALRNPNQISPNKCARNTCAKLKISSDKIYLTSLDCVFACVCTQTSVWLRAKTTCVHRFSVAAKFCRSNYLHVSPV